MRMEAKILLAFMRESNRRNIYLQDGILDVLYTVLSITKQEGNEIGELLKADLREITAMSPEFESVKRTLEKFTFL